MNELVGERVYGMYIEVITNRLANESSIRLHDDIRTHQRDLMPCHDTHPTTTTTYHEPEGPEQRQQWQLRRRQGWKASWYYSVYGMGRVRKVSIYEKEMRVILLTHLVFQERERNPLHSTHTHSFIKGNIVRASIPEQVWMSTSRSPFGRINFIWNII